MKALIFGILLINTLAFSKFIIDNQFDSKKITLPLSTRGKHIIDKSGKIVKLRCVNWYGAHMERYVVNGLDELHIDTIARNISDFGFNCVRLPYSLEQFYTNPVV